MILTIEQGGFGYPGSGSAIFEGIDLQVEAGEILCILGPNGVGKTSLLKCLSGLAPLTQGRVSLRGQDISTMRRRQIAGLVAHVPQFHTPVFAYSVFDTVLMGRTPHLGFFSFPAPADERLARQAIDAVGISHLADKPYTEISGGERQLVLFARVLAQDPEVIILDEPTSHLDYGNQVRVLALIHQLSRSGTAVVMTSHNPDHAFMVADKVGIMFDRRIAGVDTAENIITEEALLRIYGVRVRLHRDEFFGRVCVPELDKASGVQQLHPKT